MKTWEYITRQGDTWDIIARDVYGTEQLAGNIQQANPDHLHYVEFPSGIRLVIPETPTSATAVATAPWRRGGLLSDVPNPVGKILLDQGLLIPPASDSSNEMGDHTHSTDQIYDGDIQLSSSLRSFRGQLDAKMDKAESDGRYSRKVHADQHAIGGDDRLTPADIGAVAYPPADGKSYLLSGSGLVEYVGGNDGEGGTTDHSQLANRDAANQHPQSAIQYLESDLQDIRTDLAAVDGKVAGVVESLAGKADVQVLADKVSRTEMSLELNNKADKSHRHVASDIEGLDDGGSSGGIGLWVPDKDYDIYDPPVFGEDGYLYKVISPSGPSIPVGPRNPIEEPKRTGEPSIENHLVSFPTGVQSNWRARAYGHGKFIILSYGTFFYSSDYGITWNSGTLPITKNWSAIKFNGKVFVAVSSDHTNTVLYSFNGIDWFIGYLPQAMTCDCIEWSCGRFITVGFLSNIAAASPNGVIWSESLLPSSTPWKFALDGGDRCVVLTTSAGAVFSIEDGWRVSKYNVMAGPGAGIYWRGKFIVFPDGSGMVGTSKNGIDWKYSPAPALGNWSGLVEINSILLVVAGAQNKVAWSEDGDIWNLTTPLSDGTRGACKLVKGDGFCLAGPYDGEEMRLISIDMPRVPNCWQKVG